MDTEAVGGASADFFTAETAELVDRFCAAAEDGEIFRNAPTELAQAVKLCLKALYDVTSSSMASGISAAGLPVLHVQEFDTEQIWGQLEASSGPVLKQIRKRIKGLNEEIDLIDEATEIALDELLLTANGGEGPSSSSESEDSGNDADKQEETPKVDDATISGRLDGVQQPRKRPRKGSSLPVDDRELLPTEDQFLRLDDMEKFVQDAEEAAMKANGTEAADNDISDEESDDLGDSDMEGLNPGALGSSDEGEQAIEQESNSDEEDAELARLLESASEMVGNLPQATGGKGKKRRLSAQEEGDEEEYFYDDFFGSRGPGREASAHEEDGATLDSNGLDRRENTAQADADDFDDELFGTDDIDLEDGIDEEGEELGSQDAEADEGGEDAEARAALLGSLQSMLDQKKAEEAGGLSTMSAHERKVARMAERASKLEEENMGEKQWFLRGEARAGARPLNSALEIDMDFDRSLKPPPQPTQEFTTSLEDLIKRRISDQQFDDPARREAPSAELQKQMTELDDKQSGKGLGEVYEEEFVRARAGNVVEDKDEKTRAEARLVLRSLFAKLDALSHFHFAPKPVVKDMTVQKEVPALAMEEVAPQVVSEAARQLPEEVYRPSEDSKAKDEVKGRSGRKRRRASSKRLYKKKQQQQGQDGASQKGADGSSNIIGRKSAQKESDEFAARKKDKMREKRRKSKQEDGPKMRYTRSAAVFGQIQDAKAMKADKPAAQQTSNRLKL